MRISELVKTYKLLNDPNAPDWNVKFVGAVAIAALIVAAGIGIFAYKHLGAEAPAATAPAAVSEDAPAGDPASCEATEVGHEMTRLGTTSLPKGHTLPSGCVIQ